MANMIGCSSFFCLNLSQFVGISVTELSNFAVGTIRIMNHFLNHGRYLKNIPLLKL